jgi:hypothetical protein
MDNYVAGWVSNTPSVADVPGKNITLTGQNFETPNPLTAEPNDMQLQEHLHHLIAQQRKVN